MSENELNGKSARPKRGRPRSPYGSSAGQPTVGVRIPQHMHAALQQFAEEERKDGEGYFYGSVSAVLRRLIYTYITSQDRPLDPENSRYASYDMTAEWTARIKARGDRLRKELKELEARGE